MVKPGDKVKIVTSNTEYIGFLMPEIKELKTNTIILKLENGYNIGIEKRKIEKVILLSKAKKGKKIEIKIEKKKGLPNISILSTGGTISSKVDYLTGGVSPALSAEDFIQMVPEITNYANISAKRVLQVLSEDISPEDWQKLAQQIYREINKGTSGIVVTHGTDTMHFSAAAVSFMIHPLPIPVVFVGAQRSVDRGSSDAFPNLLSAVIAASKWDGAESVICMHEESDDLANILIRGVKARKMHTERRDAFRPINDLPLARIFYDGKIEKISEYNERSKVKPKLDLKLDKKVALIYFYPGMDKKIFENYENYHGLVIGGTGLGHVATKLIPSLKKLIKNDVKVVMTSQCLYGRTHPFVYSNARKLHNIGVIYGEDMLPEVAYIKLMKVLAKTKDFEKVRNMMQRNFVGEISERLIPTSYLV